MCSHAVSIGLLSFPLLLPTCSITGVVREDGIVGYLKPTKKLDGSLPVNHLGAQAQPGLVPVQRKLSIAGLPILHLGPNYYLMGPHYVNRTHILEWHSLPLNDNKAGSHFIEF